MHVTDTLVSDLLLVDMLGKLHNKSDFVNWKVGANFQSRFELDPVSFFNVGTSAARFGSHGKESTCFASRLKNPERQSYAKILLPFTSNGEVSILVKYS
jgi:hypothetical protein